MRVSILYKIIGVLVFSILITGVAVFFTARHFMAEGFEEEAKMNLESMQKVVDTEIEGLSNKYLVNGQLIAGNNSLVGSLVSRDMQTLKSVLVDAMKQTGAQSLVLTDAKGNVIMRAHSDKTGDNIMNQSVVQRALKGESTVNIEHGATVKDVLI